MKEFNASAAHGAQYVRMVVGGRVSSGKTTFASTTPYPCFIADMTEGGYKVMDPKYADEKMWWDSKFEPHVFGIESILDVPQIITKLETLAKTGKLPWKTLVFDSLSIFGLRALRELKGNFADGRAAYGALADAVSLHVSRIHALPMHVLWLCHVDDDFNLLLPGKATAAIWANMDFKVLTFANTSGKNTEYELRTQPFRGANWLGGRGGAKVRLPDPMIPSFKCVAEVLGLPEKPVSLACPTFQGVAYPNGVSYV